MHMLSWALWTLCGLTVLAIVMDRIGSRVKVPSGHPLPGGLKPTLAAELARSRAEVDQIVGPPNSPEGESNRSTVRLLQVLDLPFIVAYTLLFFVLGHFEIILSFPGALALGMASCGSAIAAGVADVLEDFAILRALRGQEGSVRRFGIPKWLFFFLVLLGESVLFFFFPAPNPVQHGLAILVGVLFLVAGIGGTAAIVLRRDPWIQKVVMVFGLGLLLLLALLILHKLQMVT
jgi:hypothetical protein